MRLWGLRYRSNIILTGFALGLVLLPLGAESFPVRALEPLTMLDFVQCLTTDESIRLGDPNSGDSPLLSGCEIDIEDRAVRPRPRPLRRSEIDTPN